MSILHEAAGKGQKEVVIELLNHGADPNFKNDDGDTSLHFASLDGCETVVIELLNGGADPKSKDKNGHTPLHFSSYGRKKEHKEIVIRLLNHGADPNSKDIFNLTPLHKASQIGQKETVIELLNHGADPSCKDSDGDTPSDINEEMGKVIRQHVTKLNLQKMFRITLMAMTFNRYKNDFLARYYEPNGKGCELAESRFKSRLE